VNYDERQLTSIDQKNSFHNSAPDVTHLKLKGSDSVPLEGWLNRKRGHSNTGKIKI
jgi:hypothetical protein